MDKGLSEDHRWKPKTQLQWPGHGAPRRQNYDLDPRTKTFAPEYAHIIGVPFKMFKGGTTETSSPPDYTRIYALPERQEKYEITFPNLAGYRVEPVEGDISVDFSKVENYEFDESGKRCQHGRRSEQDE